MPHTRENHATNKKPLDFSALQLRAESNSAKQAGIGGSIVTAP